MTEREARYKGRSFSSAPTGVVREAAPRGGMSEQKEEAVARVRWGQEGCGVADFGKCFSGLHVAMEGGPLKELEPEMLKNEIKRWAKVVVAYARQLSGGFAGTGARSSE